jgi:hypothetical protein
MNGNTGRICRNPIFTLLVRDRTKKEIGTANSIDSAEKLKGKGNAVLALAKRNPHRSM